MSKSEINEKNIVSSISDLVPKFYLFWIPSFSSKLHVIPVSFYSVFCKHDPLIDRNLRSVIKSEIKHQLINNK
jgi:hypothetical protein